MKTKEFSLIVGEGDSEHKITAEFTDLAHQADGSVLLKCKNTVVLATVVMNSAKENDFLPLSVEYEERYYATGKIPGNRYMRREGKPSDEAVATARIVDRTIRPLFDPWIRNEIQVVLTVLAIGDMDPDTLSVMAASLALSTSKIPWNGPVSAVRIKNEKMDVLVCGKHGLVNMIEVAGQQVSEDDVQHAIERAAFEINELQQWQEKIIEAVGQEKIKIPKPEISIELAQLFAKEIAPSLTSQLFGKDATAKLDELKRKWLEILPDKNLKGIAETHFEESVNDFLHQEALGHGRRADNRDTDEIRPLRVQAGGVSSVLHGSGTFYRGDTHILSVLTLGGPNDSLLIDGAEVIGSKRFIHHYNFPPFSVGDTGKVGMPNRRMIGHGLLAEKALLPVIPSRELFPYTIRLVSEAFASNGSTSMASVCGSTIALMDGGVPITTPVAGISIGLMMESTNGTGKYILLTDIQGPEDHYGDMDFKVAGTKNGITAIQLDVKIEGITFEIIHETLQKARAARLQILKVIESAIAAPRATVAPSAPHIIFFTINKENIGQVIGAGGKTINEIKQKTGITDITIEDDGTVYVTGKQGTAEKARDTIMALIQSNREHNHRGHFRQEGR